MMNKLAVVTMQFLIIMLVSVLGFFVIFSFLTTTGDSVLSEIEEQRCKAYLQAKSNSIVKIADFFLGLSNSCKTDYIESDNDEKEEVFRLIAERSRSCWERYGSGELDFMSNYDTTGEYCFPCSQIVFNEVDFQYEYTEFIEWIQNNRPENSDKTYAELTNFEYFNSTQQFEETIASLNELQEQFKRYLDQEGGTELIELSLYMTDYKNELLNMKNKRISSDENNYVVFRYVRVDNEMSETIKNTVAVAARNAAASYVAGSVTRILLSGPIGVVTSMVSLANKAQDASRLSRIIEKTVSVINTIRKAKKSTKVLSAGTGAGVGGYVGSNINKNAHQHLDIIGEEEYFRKCGVQPHVEQ